MEMGAYTCALVIPGEDQEMDLSYDVAAGAYVARVVRLEVKGVMDPDCSWWNPGETVFPPEYTLQHEQIHFALVEISARRLAQKLRAMEVTADTGTSAARELQQMIESAFQDTIREITESNTRFDQDTSGAYRPQRQARWMVYVEEELKRVPASPERPAREHREPRAQPEWERWGG
jgi:hypothetical protein